MGSDIQVIGHQVVGDGPEIKHLIGGPHGDSAAQGVEHIVPYLVVHEESGCVFERRGLGIIFPICSLYLENIEVQMQSTGDDED